MDMSFNGSDRLIIHMKNEMGKDFGYLVIDSILNNTSSGGVRIMEDISLEEIEAMAREMTLKYNFIGLNRGAAKSGIKIARMTPYKERIGILTEFGRRLAPIIRNGIYCPGRDMNCSEEDLRMIYKGAGISLGKITNTSFFTAISLENAVSVCKEVYKLTDPIKLAIEGFGNVGRYLAERLNPEVFQIVAVSTQKGAIFMPKGFSLNKLLESKDKYGDDFVLRFPDAKIIEKKAILNLDVDILIPCARIWAINENNAGEIKSRFIVPGANVPYTQEALNILHKKGTICLPGFVCNSGGVYGSSMFDNGVSLKDIETFSKNHFKRIIMILLDKSEALNISPVDLAMMIAKSRFIKKKMENENPSIFEKVIKRSLSKKLFPKSVFGALWLNRFKANLVALEKEILGFQVDDNG